jgi:hypothetical protein
MSFASFVLSRLSALQAKHLCAAFIALVLAKAAFLIGMPDAMRVAHMPDDAYYYFGLARNFAASGHWTSDGGISSATGFHLLYAYTLALLSWVGVVNLPVAGIALNALSAVVACWLLIVVVHRLYGPLAMLFVAPLLTSACFQAGAVSGMEWGFCLVFMCAYVRALASAAEPVGRCHPAWQAFVWALLMELSRSDAGLLAAAMLAAAWLRRRQHPRDLMLRSTVAGLMGASLGLVITLAHTHALRGKFITGSAEVKHLWASRHSISTAIRGGYHLFLNTLGMPPGSEGVAVMTALGLTLTLLAILLWRQRARWGTAAARRAGPRPPSPDADAAAITLGAGGALACVGYMGVLSQNIAAFYWYSALLIPGLALSLGLLARLLVLASAQRTLALWVAASAALIAVGLAQFARPVEPHQVYMYEAAQHINATPGNTRFGAWNAGIMGYYSTPGRLINLDGLVNDNAIPYIRRNELDAYITETGITQLIDFEGAVTRREPQQSGGFFNARFHQAISKGTAISPRTGYLDSAMTLFAWRPAAP